MIIGRSIGAPGHGREVVDIHNDTERRLILHLIATLQLTDSQMYDTQMVMNTSTQNSDVRLAQKVQNHLSNASQKHSILDNGKYKKQSSKQKWTNR